MIATTSRAGTPGLAACRFVYLRSTPTEPPDLWMFELGRKSLSKPRRLTTFNAEVLDELELREPLDRHVTVDGRDIQGWLIPGGDGPRPLVVQIHGGPHTLYGWSPSWEFQTLAAAGIGVFYCNPRGSEGYGEAFNDANHRDWGPGPRATSWPASTLSWPTAWRTRIAWASPAARTAATSRAGSSATTSASVPR